MDNMYFNKNAGRPQRPSGRSDGYDGAFEDISSFSKNYVEDEYEDISSGRNMYDDFDDYDGIPMDRPARQNRNASRERNGNMRGRELPQNSQRKRKSRGDDFDDISSSSHGHGGKPPKRKKRKHRVLKSIFIIILIIILAIAGTGYSLLGKMKGDSSEKHQNQYISDDQLHADKNVTNILLLGVDAREGETTSRSDTMMLISIDKNNKKIKLTSFLRDSYVEIPGYGYNKLNAACSKGGVSLVWDTIEYNYKIKIDNYMMVDFKAFEELIDAIGGVDVEVTEKEANYLNNTWAMWSLTGNPLHFDSGESVHLNGEEALMFCRIRKLDSDFYRTERQRRTIAAVKKSLMGSSPTELYNMANKVLPLIETDISSNEMVSLCLKGLFSYLKYDMASMGIPADGTWHSERKSCGDSLVFDIDENARILQNYIYLDEYNGKEDA